MNPLVSIIIPTYNRAHLIGETLDSIIAQTYTNWECIVVDDGSTDETDSLLAAYCAKDKRFQYHHRPSDRPKGANACRNYGFELSKGEYVNWFDSDDLMDVENIAIKIESIGNYDFVVSYCLDFDENKIIGKIYDFDFNIPITAENFVTQRIGWITNDALIRKNTLENTKFNEKLNLGQEYNFFSRFLYITDNGRFINKCLAKRRVHAESIDNKTKLDQIKYKVELFRNEKILLDDLKSIASEKIINRSLLRIIRFSYESQKVHSINKRQLVVLSTLLKFKMFIASIYYISWIGSNMFFGRGYYFIKKVYNLFKND